MPLLYDNLGRPIDFDTPDPDFSVPHVFTFGSIIAGGWATYFHEHWDEAMRHRRENALVMKRDAFILALLRERHDATLSCKWAVEPDNKKDPTELATSQAIGKAVRMIRHLRHVKRQLLWANWYGRAGVQVKWGWKTINVPAPVYSGPAESGLKPNIEHVQQRVWTVLKSLPVQGDKIGFTWNGMPFILAGAAQGYHKQASYGLASPWDYIFTSTAPAVLLRNPQLRRKFIIHRHDPDDADYFEPEMAGGVFGVGIRSRLYWCDYMRREYLSWVTDTFERIGLGLVVIEYDASNADAETKAIKIAKTYSRRAAIVMPVTPDRTNIHGSVRVVEAPIAGAQFVLQLVQALEGQMERYVIGQSMTGGQGAGDALGGQGKAMLQWDTKHQIVLNDAGDLDETLAGSFDDGEPGLLDTMMRFTYPHLHGKFQLFHRTSVDEIDPLTKLGAIAQAAQLGAKFKEDEVVELTGCSAPDDGDRVLPPDQPQQQPGRPPAGMGSGGGEPNMAEALAPSGEPGAVAPPMPPAPAAGPPQMPMMG